MMAGISMTLAHAHTPRTVVSIIMTAIEKKL